MNATETSEPSSWIETKLLWSKYEYLKALQEKNSHPVCQPAKNNNTHAFRFVLSLVRRSPKQKWKYPLNTNPITLLWVIKFLLNSLRFYILRLLSLRNSPGKNSVCLSWILASSCRQLFVYSTVQCIAINNLPKNLHRKTTDRTIKIQCHPKLNWKLRHVI